MLYWAHREELLSCSRDALPTEVLTIVQSNQSNGAKVNQSLQGISAVNNQISFLVGASFVDRLDKFDAVIRVRSRLGEAETGEEGNKDPSILVVAAAKGKKEQLHYLHNVLPTVQIFARRWFDKPGSSMLIIDETGDYDASIGILMLLLARFFDENGKESLAQYSSPSMS